jgi:hypothetical protein
MSEAKPLSLSEEVIADAELPIQAADRQRILIGYGMAAAGAILFSLKAIIVKLAYELDVDPETLLALRMGFSLPFYLGVGFLAIRPRQHKLAAIPSLRLRCARSLSARSACGWRATPIFSGCNTSRRNSSG